MEIPGTDIIIPVWNRPAETRACLVSLVQHSSDSRFILLNNGCDRETECILEEFAEALDDRALLIGSGVNLGFVRAVNRGLARAEAAFAAVVRTSSVVSPGWLDPLRQAAADRPEAGIIIPHIVPRPGSRVPGTPSAARVSETSYGDFSAMLVRRALYEKIGGFDEEMDGGLWCLTDYSRRALRAGFLTFTVEGVSVFSGEEQLLGAPARREAAMARSRAACRERWGEEQAFCVYFPKETELSVLEQSLDVMLRGARLGHTFTALVPPGRYRDLVGNASERLHTGIRLEKYPRIFSAGHVKRTIVSLGTAAQKVVPVSGIAGVPFPGHDGSVAFADLKRLIDDTMAEKFSRG